MLGVVLISITPIENSNIKCILCGKKERLNEIVIIEFVRHDILFLIWREKHINTGNICI